MSADVSTVEPHGGTATTARVRRRLVVIGSITVAIALLVALWWWQSTPYVAQGSTVGPSGGTVVVDDTDPFAATGSQIWRQTQPAAWAAWSVYNDGRYAVTLTQEPAPNYPNAMPRRSVQFLPGRADGGSPDGLFGATPTGLQDSVTIEPGQEGFLVAEVFYPGSCLVSDPSAAVQGPTYEWETVSVDARVLGRTTTLTLPLPQRLDTPTQPGTCPLEAFGGR
ncbi:MAG: hypothetical protein U0R68_14055 [Candidatus Nanopelagicales bacterium]